MALNFPVRTALACCVSFLVCVKIIIIIFIFFHFPCDFFFDPLVVQVCVI